MRLLILGGTGMLGYQVLKTCFRRNIDAHAIVRSLQLLEGNIPSSKLSRVHVLEEVRDLERLENLVKQIKPTHLINCIGIVKQSTLANDFIESIGINSLLPHQLQVIAERNDFKLLHISTDCVFNGKKGNYKEDDPSDAYDLYGQTKFLGEVGYGNAITLRTSIIGHELSSTSHGLIEWFLAQTGPIKGYKKAIFSGLTTLELTNVILDYIIPGDLAPDLYQVAALPINKFDLLQLTSEVYGKEIVINPEEEFEVDRSLDGSRFATLLNYQVPTWRKLIEAMREDRMTSFS